MSNNGASFPQQENWGGYGYDDPAETDASFLLTVVPGNQMLALSWPAQQGAIGYEVFCGANPENLVRVGKNITATSFIIWNLVVGRPYYVQVIARYPNPRAGINTETVIGIPQPYLPQLAPVLSVTTDGTLMYLSWTAPPGTSYYSINVSNRTGQEQVYLTGYRGTTLAVPNFNNGGGYFFNVTAFNVSGAAATSNEVSVQSVATPTLSPPPGSNYRTPQQVSLATTTPNAAIFYTEDGTAPNDETSPLYSGPFTIGNLAPASQTTVNAIATAPGMLDSQVGSSVYGVNQLLGLSWMLPCITYYNGGLGCTCALSVTSSITLNAPAGSKYNVTFRIRGLMELKSFTGGTGSGYFQIGGAPDVQNGNNWYRLTISDPPQTFYLNRNSDPSDPHTQVYVMDYLETIQVNAGATITMYADSGGDSTEAAYPAGQVVSDNDPLRPVVVPQPYGGQFAQIDAETIVQL